MSPKSIALTASAALGSLACFLKFVGGMSLSEIGHLPGSTKVNLPMFLAPFLILLALGGVALALSKRVARWQGIVGTLASLGLLVFLDSAALHGKFKPAGFLTVLSEGDIGGKLIVVAFIAAIATCLAAVIKPDPKVA